MIKICSKCKIKKAITAFGKDKHTKDGLHCYCKDCRKKYSVKKKYSRQYRINNKEKMKKNSKQYRIKNKEKIKEKSNQYYIDNKEKKNRI